jgi:mgtE-like transporter
VISIVGGAIGSVLVLTITIGLSALSYRLEWDLDSVSTPMVTALGDMTTLPSLFLATFLVRNEAVAVGVGIVAIGVAVAATVRSYINRDPRVRRIVLEMTATILLTPILDILSGGLQQARLAELTAVPVLLLLIPPFVSQAGALGGIFSSRITSKLQIGVITPSGRPETPAIVDGSIVLGLSLVVFTMIGAISWALGATTGLPGMPGAWTLIGATLLAGVLVTPLTVLAGYYLAIVTYRFGLDPDNQGVPIITSVMDLAGVAVILIVMTSSGVLHG